MVAELNTGHQCTARALMKPAEIVEDQRLQPAQTIVPGVAVEIGMKATQYRNPEAFGGAHCRPAERPLRCHIHDIWTVLRPAALQQPRRWQANMHPLIPRHRQAGHHGHLGIATVTRTIQGLLAWTYHGYRMTLHTQSFYEMSQGHSDTVDFRRIGFADNTDMSLI